MQAEEKEREIKVCLINVNAAMSELYFMIYQDLE